MKTPEEIQDWLKDLRTAYPKAIDIEHEYNKMCIWCKAHHKQPTERRFIAWLNRIDVLPTSKPQPVYGRIINMLPPINEVSETARQEFMQNARAEVAKLKEQLRMP